MRSLYAWFLKLEAILAGIFLMLMVALIFLGGVARLVSHPMNWTIDLSTAFFAWACFLCADIAWRNDSLMSIDLVPSILTPRMRAILTYSNYLIIAAFLCYLIYSGTILTIVTYERAFQGIPSISYSWVTASLPICATLLLITTLLKVRSTMQQDGFLRSRNA